MCRWGCSERSKVRQVIMALNYWEPSACESILNEKVSFEWSRPADYVHKLIVHKLVYRRTDQACVKGKFWNRYIKGKLLQEIKKRAATHLSEIRLKLASIWLLRFKFADQVQVLWN